MAKLEVINAGPRARLIEKALEQCVEQEIETVCNDLLIARSFWREHRSMVESEAFPEPYLSVRIKHNNDTAPDEHDAWHSNAGLSVEQLREKMRPEAEMRAKQRWDYLKASQSKRITT